MGGGVLGVAEGYIGKASFVKAVLTSPPWPSHPLPVQVREAWQEISDIIL